MAVGASVEGRPGVPTRRAGARCHPASRVLVESGCTQSVAELEEKSAPTRLASSLPPGRGPSPTLMDHLSGTNFVQTPIFINPWLTQDSEGRPTAVPIDRRVLVVIPAKNQRTGESTILVARSYDANEQGLPGPYRNSVAARIRLEQTFEGSGTEPATGTELWEVNVDGGAIVLHLEYQRAVAIQSNPETRPRSAVDPTIQRVYRVDQGLDLVRSVPGKIDRVQAFSLRVSVPELRAVFDGSERAISVALYPWLPAASFASEVRLPIPGRAKSPYTAWEPRLRHRALNTPPPRALPKRRCSSSGSCSANSETFRMRLGSSRSVIGLSIARQERKDIVRRDDGDTAVLTQIEQLLISSHQVISLRDTCRS